MEYIFLICNCNQEFHASGLSHNLFSKWDIPVKSPLQYRNESNSIARPMKLKGNKSHGGVGPMHIKELLKHNHL